VNNPYGEPVCRLTFIKRSTATTIKLLFVYCQPETITELVRKQKEHQIKKEIIEESDITDSAVTCTQSQDASEIEEITKPSTVIANPLTPPTPDPLTKDKTHIKLEALPVSSCGMMDRTRVALFAFMFTFLFINPLSYVIPQLDKGNYVVPHFVNYSNCLAFSMQNRGIFVCNVCLISATSSVFNQATKI